MDGDGWNFLQCPTYEAVVNTEKLGTKAGTKTQKQNVFDDFISAAEYLIGQTSTLSSANLGIQGGSKRWLARRCLYDATSRSVWCVLAGGRCNGHASFP